MKEQIRKVYQVKIYDKLRWVYDIPESIKKPHGGYNDTPNTYWIYMGDEYADGVIPPLDSESWNPMSSSIKRIVWDISIKQKNTTKEKWGETQFRNHTDVEIYANGKLFYSFGTIGGNNGIAFAFAKIQYLQTALSEHPFNFFDPDSENGRKIWWKNLPATVGIRNSEQKWEILIIPDYTTGLTKEQWWSELLKKEQKISISEEEKESDDEFQDDDDSNQEYINWGDAFSDQHIGWFRK